MWAYTVFQLAFVYRRSESIMECFVQRYNNFKYLRVRKPTVPGYQHSSSTHPQQSFPRVWPMDVENYAIHAASCVVLEKDSSPRLGLGLKRLGLGSLLKTRGLPKTRTGQSFKNKRTTRDY